MDATAEIDLQRVQPAWPHGLPPLQSHDENDSYGLTAAEQLSPADRSSFVGRRNPAPSPDRLAAASPDTLDDPMLVDGRLFVGDSAAARQVRRMISRVAGTGVTTLIHGETGTGKEIVALLLHRNSPRASGPLVAVNCAAIPEAMVEGELFGYEKGAFSGAVRSYPGKFGLADGGTLFLDEIGELSLAAQAKILRAIESREIFPLGSLRSHRCRVRIVAATNRDLGAEVAAGRFRADLYYRLAVVRLQIPPLADRRADIAGISRYLLRDLAIELGCPEPAIDADALAELERRPWPGNVRELRNTLEHAIVIARDPRRLCVTDLPRALDRAPASPPPASPPAVTAPAQPGLERDELLRTIRTCGGKAGAARLLNVSRTTLYRRLQRLGLDPATV